MINSFDTDVAQDVGIVAAILYKNIQYWCLKNKANEINEHDGLFWTYNSMKAYQELFPYLGVKAIRAGLDKLEEQGYIKVGNFNENKRDRTRWYADLHLTSNIEAPQEPDSNTPKGQMQEDEKDTCNMPKGQMESAERANASSEKGEPLPNNYQITTTNKKEVSKKVSSGNNARAKEPSFDEILDSVDVIKDNPELREAFVNFIKMRKVIKAQLTNRGLELAINRAFEIAKGNPQKMIAVVNQSVERSWRGIFELTEDKVEPKSHEQLAKEAEKERAENPYYKRLEEKGVI